MSSSLAVAFPLLGVLFCYPILGVGNPERWFVGICAVAIVFAASGITAATVPREGTRSGGVFLAVSFGLLLGLSACARMNTIRGSGYTTVPLSTVTTLEGTVAEDSYVSSGGEVVVKLDLIRAGSTLSDTSGTASGRVLVLLDDDRILARGQRVSIDGRLSVLSGFGRETFFSRAREVTVFGYSSGLFLFRHRLKAALAESIDRLGSPASELLKTLFLGVKENLPDDLQSTLDRTGTRHVLALSGLHVGIIYLIVIFAFRPISGRAARLCIGIGFIAAYVFLVGARASLLRAAFLLALGGLGSILDRDLDALNMLCLSAVVLCIVDPFSVYTLSFQLSYLALLGMLTLGRLIVFRLESFVPDVVRYPLAYSIGAQAMSAPIVVYHFGSLYPVGVVASFFVIPAVTVFLAIGMLSIALSLLGISMGVHACSWVLNLLYRVLSATTALLAQVPGIRMPTERPLLSLVIAFIVLLVTGTLSLRARACVRDCNDV